MPVFRQVSTVEQWISYIEPKKFSYKKIIFEPNLQKILERQTSESRKDPFCNMLRNFYIKINLIRYNCLEKKVMGVVLVVCNSKTARIYLNMHKKFMIKRQHIYA